MSPQLGAPPPHAPLEGSAQRGPDQGQGRCWASGAGKVLAAHPLRGCSLAEDAAVPSTASRPRPPLLNTQALPSPPTTLPGSHPRPLRHPAKKPQRRATTRTVSPGTACPPQSGAEAPFHGEGNLRLREAEWLVQIAQRVRGRAGIRTQLSTAPEPPLSSGQPGTRCR